MNTERRKTVRFLPRTEAYVALRPDFTKLGRLINISRGGLAFRYLAHQRQEQAPTHLDLFTSNDGFHLSRLACRVIYDIRFPENEKSSKLFEHRRCGMKFGEVTEVQATQLEFYLKNHVAGEA
ncbi:MAG: PilZ domain-containing protein [Deltaproteobacteria bacterium]|nr:MAG: PilZ domain-containing protein [Deltaproteobacteria bacterium]